MSSRLGKGVNDGTRGFSGDERGQAPGEDVGGRACGWRIGGGALKGEKTF